MELSNSFGVAVRPEVAWQTVGDMDQVARCLPGAQIDSREGDTYRGRVAIKVGPISMGMSGTATVIDRDDDHHRMAVRMQAEDSSGQGTVEATMRVSATASPGGTTITIDTSMQLGGKVAQFGSGLINQVSGRIVKQVAKRMAALVEEQFGGGQPATNGTAAGTGAPGTYPSGGAEGLVATVLPLVAVALAGVLFGWSLGRSLRRVTASPLIRRPSHRIGC